MKILMVCLGNICRSPLAEGIMAQLIAQHQLPWQVDSAGTNRQHTNEPPHRLSQKVALMNGIDISTQRARDFTAADVEQFDLILAMAQDVMDAIALIYKAPLPAHIHLITTYANIPSRNGIPDPWYGEESGYHEVFAQLKQCCEHILFKHKNAMI